MSDKQLDLDLGIPKKKKKQTKRAQSAQKKRNTKKGNEAQRRAEQKRGETEFGRDGKIKPEDIWPNYPNMNALKIGTKLYQAYQLGRDALKIIPALTGLGMRR